MIGQLSQWVIAAAVLVAWAAVSPAQTPDPTNPGQRGVLLLRNGRVLEGVITRVDGTYRVALDRGEIRLAAGAVELVCRDLEEGYRRKRAAIGIGDVSEHLRLAYWCLRHDLFGPAARELADAVDADPSHPMIAVLRRRLEVEMAARAKSYAPRAAPQPQVAPQATKPADDPTTATSTSPPPEELDRLLGTLPAGTVETFTRSVQPVLVNNCAAAACHGPQSTAEYRLQRIPPGSAPRRKTTQLNLYATLQLIDRQAPRQSPLLTATLGPHGTAKTAVFSNRNAAAYRRLADWVDRLAESATSERSSVAAASTGSQGSEKLFPQLAEAYGSPLTADRASSELDVPPSEEDPWSSFSAEYPGQPPVVRLKEERPAEVPDLPKRGNPLPGFVPVDPFDPEIFNRRYFGHGARR
jgi:hypothetical protein